MTCQRISEDIAPNKDRERVFGELPTILVPEVGVTGVGVDEDQPVSKPLTHTTLYMSPHSTVVVAATASTALLEDEEAGVLFLRSRKCYDLRDLCTPTVSLEVEIPMVAAGVLGVALLSAR